MQGTGQAAADSHQPTDNPPTQPTPRLTAGPCSDKEQRESRWPPRSQRDARVGRLATVARWTVTINGSPISFDGPFGGYKASSTGREYGAVGLSEYLEHKSVTRKTPNLIE
jgi:hypothetical protein